MTKITIVITKNSRNAIRVFSYLSDKKKRMKDRLDKHAHNINQTKHRCIT